MLSNCQITPEMFCKPKAPIMNLQCFFFSKHSFFFIGLDSLSHYDQLSKHLKHLLDKPNNLLASESCLSTLVEVLQLVRDTTSWSSKLSRP